MAQYRLGMLYSIGAGLLYGICPMITSVIMDSGINSASYSFLCYLMGELLLIPLLLRKYPKGERLPKRRHLGHLTVLAFGMAIAPVLLYASYDTVGIGMATTLHFTYPMFTALLCILVFRQKARFWDLFCLVMTIAGVAFCNGFSGSGNLSGVAVAVLSGLILGLYYAYLGNCPLQNIGSLRLACWMNVEVALILGLIVLFGGNLTLPRAPKIWLLILVMAQFITVVGLLLLQKGVMLIGSQKASILGTLEPLFAMISGVVLLHEPFGFGKALGVVLILGAVILLAVFDKPKEA